MGLYPPGSLLELSDRRWVLVVSGGRDAERFAWPRVRPARDEDGRPLEEADDLDLFEVRAAIRPRRVLNPATQGVDIAAMLEGAFDKPPR
jgi:hypothetical protein